MSLGWEIQGHPSLHIKHYIRHIHCVPQQKVCAQATGFDIHSQTFTPHLHDLLETEKEVLEQRRVSLFKQVLHRNHNRYNVLYRVLLDNLDRTRRVGR